MKKHYYAGQSAHGSESSHGFANDWDVFVFDNKPDRDAFVEGSRNISTVAVLAKDATRYASNYSLTSNCYCKPAPFTTEYWGIDAALIEPSAIAGLIGQLVVCDSYRQTCERFYN